MSNMRTVMVGTGGALVVLSVAGIVVRLVQAGPYTATLGAMSAPAAYGTMVAMLAVGFLLMLFAPPSRRTERRVSLEPNPTQQETLLRPGNREGIPRTRGFDGPGKAAATHAEPGINPPQQRTPQPPVGTPRPAQMTLNDGAYASGHPNDPAADPDSVSAHEANGADPDGMRQWAEARTSTFDPDEDTRLERARQRRQELMSRLEELDLKANSAKVRLGLGKISASGYRQYLEEVDRERTLIESELMEDEVQE